MFFILSKLYLSGMFLIKRGCLPDHLSRGYNRGKERVLCTVKIGTFSPGNRPCHLTAPLDLSHALGGGKEKAGSGPSLPPFAAAASIKNGPQERALGVVV